MLLVQDAHFSDRLPPELYDRIIDFVASDQPRDRTLRSCALTCRLWLPRARFHLFRAVGLSSFSGYDRLDAILQKNPDIASCIRTLQFEIGAGGMSFLDQARVLPVSLLARLPLLKSVTYYSGLTAQTPVLRDHIASLPRMDTVTTFNINVCVFQRFSDLIMLLAAFPSLSTLSLSEVMFVDREYHACLADGRFSHHTPLTYLHLESLHEAPAIFGWLMETSSFSQLSTLSVGLDRSENLNDFVAFLQLCGDSVSHLSLRSRSLVDNKFLGLDLSLNANLRSISLRVVLLRDIQQFPGFLATASSSILWRINIRLLPGVTAPTAQAIKRDLDAVECAPFDDLLTSQQFFSLRMVVFDFSCPMKASEIRPILASRFPQLHSRGHMFVHREFF